MLAAIALTGCANTLTENVGTQSTASDDEELSAALGMMMRGESQMQGAELEKAIEKASAFPLGTAENPVRAHMPPGQRAYLGRLRCSDLSRPSFFRIGSAGLSPYGNIADVYSVTCETGEPAQSEIYIDMYHSGYSENEAVPGFGIAGGRSE